MALYDAFISYSHAADGRLAPVLQRGLRVKFALFVFARGLGEELAPGRALLAAGAGDALVQLA